MARIHPPGALEAKRDAASSQVPGVCGWVSAQVRHRGQAGVVALGSRLARGYRRSRDGEDDAARLERVCYRRAAGLSCPCFCLLWLCPGCYNVIAEGMHAERAAARKAAVARRAARLPCCGAAEGLRAVVLLRGRGGIGGRGRVGRGGGVGGGRGEVARGGVAAREGGGGGRGEEVGALVWARGVLGVKGQGGGGGVGGATRGNVQLVGMGGMREDVDAEADVDVDVDAEVGEGRQRASSNWARHASTRATVILSARCSIGRRIAMGMGTSSPALLLQYDAASSWSSSSSSSWSSSSSELEEVEVEADADDGGRRRARGGGAGISTSWMTRIVGPRRAGGLSSRGIWMSRELVA
ncbi:hypothetical protein DFH09DRAFT_1080795 [Mycena vulgaris]|nr:hypothetical protein DFH09DRAFT_1080795 [Mycena vulgaris]